MNRTGHLGAGLLIYAPAFAALLRVDSSVAGIIGLVIVLWTAPLPDIDLRLPGLAHRGPTHSVAFALVVGFIWTLFGWMAGEYLATTALPALAGVDLLATPLGWQHFFEDLHTIDRGSLALIAGGSGLLGIVSHLLVDVITPAGIAPFWPVSSNRYSLGLCRSSNRVANSLLFVLGTGAISIILIVR